MSEMLEKVARQVNDEMPHLAKWETLTPGMKAECIDVVRRVVRALREPDEGMLKVGQREYLFGVNFCAGEPYASDEAAYQLWLSMVDSILSTPTTRGEVK